MMSWMARVLQLRIFLETLDLGRVSIRKIDDEETTFTNGGNRFDAADMDCMNLIASQ